MIRVLVSACLLGQPVRYNGSAKPCEHPALKQWRQENRLLAYCPEVEAGLGTPRPAAEIQEGTGFAVLDSRARVITASGQDVTAQFVAGASKTLQTALAAHVRLAVLTDGSPSCGSTYIYDGAFGGQRQPGAGVTTALLEQNGIRVFSQTQIDQAEQYLNQLLQAESRQLK